MTLTWRVLALIAAVHLAVILGAGSVMLLNARRAVAIEITAARDSAVVLIRDLVRRRADEPARLIADLRGGIVQPRHVRIRFVPADGLSPVDLPTPHGGAEPVPGWFLDWVSPVIATAVLPVTAANGVPRGQIEVVATPEDEAREVWEDARALFLVWIGATILLLPMLALLVGRALAPLSRLEHRLSRMQSGDYARAAAATESPDLRAIGARIDQLAATLRTSEEERRILARQLLDLRDAERKSLARELHDELGPCLFSLSVMADQLRTDPERAAAHAGDIDMLVSRIRVTNRRILDTLRPATVGNLPLGDVLTDLVGAFQDAHPGTRFLLDVPAGLSRTSEIVDMTLYRILQEALTNALRHGKAREIRIRLSEAAQGFLRMEVADNGEGLSPCWSKGRGLLGMRERIAALNGSLALTAPASGTGAVLTATVMRDET